MSKEIQIWDDQKQLTEIKKIYGKNLTDGEFTTLCRIGQATGLNPFLRELWAVKYGSNDASIFIGRDGYRKSAQKQKDYDYHHADSVCENDEFNVVNGEIQHKYNVKNRGKVIGAYAVCKKKEASKPIYKFVDFEEYNTGKSLWVKKPKTMIEKVAEAQVLRMTFQDIFAGTYDESEDWGDNVIEAKETKKVPVKKKILKEQTEMINNLWGEFYDLLSAKDKKKFPTDDMHKIKLAMINKLYQKDGKLIKSITALSYDQAEEFIGLVSQKLTEEKVSDIEDGEIVNNEKKEEKVSDMVSEVFKKDEK